MTCKFNKIIDYMTGNQKRKDWEKIQCLILKLAQEKKESRRYKEFWTNAREAFLLLRAPEGKIIDANPTACSLYGYTYEDIKTKTIFDLSAEPESTQQSYDSKSMYVPFRYHKNADGTLFLINCSLTYFQDNGSDEIAALIVRRIEEHRSQDGIVKDRKIK